LDCWGLVRFVYGEELGVVLPSYKGIYTDSNVQSLRKAAEVMDREKAAWVKVDDMRPFDVLLLRARGKLAAHVGVYVDRGFMLHSQERVGAMTELVIDSLRPNRLVGIFRHASHR
jgi:cell wall-associated NlpC family hydrolase